jgi:serpin B
VVTISTACAANNRTIKISNTLSKNVNSFNWNYYRQLDKDKNIFYSPYSIAAAFSIVANGATGNTQKEILAALNAKSIDNLNGEFENFRKFIEKNYRNGTILNEADLILVNKNFVGKGINSKFQKTVENIYKSKVEAADFTGNVDAEKARIKNWVSKNTNAFIPNYEAAIDPETIVDILDVIYFKGKWEDQFDTSKTWKSDFKNKDGKKSKVQMMSKTFEDSIAYYADEKYMAIAMPYQNNLASMYVIMPLDENNLNVAEDWDAEEISYRENFLDNLKNAPIFDGRVEVFIPKFELDIKNNLNDDLQAMGIKQAFTDNAEFNNIVKKMQLKISNANHQAKVKVDEVGTEAAAVTEITMMKATAVPIKPKTIYFRADRPFLFVIRDVQSEIDLFTGVVNELK